MHPRDRDAVAKYRECEKAVKAAAFAAAIETEETMPLSQTINLDKIGAFCRYAHAPFIQTHR